MKKKIRKAIYRGLMDQMERQRLNRLPEWIAALSAVMLILVTIVGAIICTTWYHETRQPQALTIALISVAAFLVRYRLSVGMLMLAFGDYSQTEWNIRPSRLVAFWEGLWGSSQFPQRRRLGFFSAAIIVLSSPLVIDKIAGTTSELSLWFFNWGFGLCLVFEICWWPQIEISRLQADSKDGWVRALRFEREVSNQQIYWYEMICRIEASLYEARHLGQQAHRKIREDLTSWLIRHPRSDQLNTYQLRALEERLHKPTVNVPSAS